ncbi:3'-5' exonuclease [Pseudomonas matsuisoli]|uniref:DNA polymerase III subunit epsilon n=1 Tax=Pseudomonas matsuisoli TaxID=1515666 RepID=A0A917V0B7_9PSED|nr:3'-5' exonuclease [Pseudomonas matsuisoli]GGK04581.1 DNA polymerase III subunit epsilon [Pseudomonas matsuisoli]
MRFFPWGNRSVTPELTLEQGRRLDSLRALRPREDLDIREGRMVVVDVETTGLNMQKDRVLSIGAVTIEHGAIDLGQCFECTLRREALPGASTLIHGLGPEALADGDEPSDALLAFLDYLGESPLLAFHADFDQRMLTRAFKEDLGYSFQHPFLDIAELAPLLHPDALPPRAGLDDWIAYFGLGVGQRHHASADALVSAELVLMLFNHARRWGTQRYAELGDQCRHWRRSCSAPGF